MCTWATFALACDNAKTTAAATSKNTKTTAVTASTAKSAGACTADMAAACTADMAAACSKTKGVNASTASAAGASDCCASKTRSAAMTAAATTAPAGKVDAVMVGSEGSCSAHGAKTTASAAGAGSCSGNGMAMKAGSKSAAHNCDACADMAMCEEELKSMGATVQAVALKNGVMFVYTADASKVQGVQSAMARRGQRMNTMLASTDKATLCPECKNMRGAIASGKLNREQVNIEGGCLTLMTSSDPAMVAKIQSMAGLKGSAHTKS
jgi:hypothetical protein